ncbi:MAG: hypothetical protein K2W33_05430 [Burkholderiales bacterium]|nr:hypothetical protein [Burkholderiales bacterium]
MNPSTDHTAHAPQQTAAGLAEARYLATTGGPGVLNRFSVDAITQRQGAGRVRNSCHRCGATAYKTLIPATKQGS